MVMGAEKSHSLLTASWRTRRTSGITQPECEGLRIRGADDVTPNLDVSDQAKGNSTFLPLYVLAQPSVDWMMPTHIEGRFSFLYLLNQC